MDKKEYTDFKAVVRKAYKAGKKTVMDPESGKLLSLMKLTRKVNYELRLGTDPTVTEKRKRTENWLVLKPEDGSLVPVFCIELTHLANLRS